MHGINCTTPTFEAIPAEKRSQVLKNLSKRSSSNVNEALDAKHLEPDQSPKSDEIRQNVKLKAASSQEHDSQQSSESLLSPDQTVALKGFKHTLEAHHELQFDLGQELRHTFFRLSLLAVALTAISWILLMIIMSILDVKCPNIIYCVILQPDIFSKSCVVSDAIELEEVNMNHRTILLVILTLWSVLISIIYAIIWQWFWRSKRNPLWTNKHQHDLTKLATNYYNSACMNTLKAWSLLIVCLLITLVIEYFVEPYMYFTGGRYLYCVLVLTLGIILIKIIGIITSNEYKHYSADELDEYDSELICADSRNCRFHRQCVLVIINTTYALYVPSIHCYPALNEHMTQASLQKYLESLNQSATEATFFLWSAIVGSQSLAFVIEMFNGYVFGSCLSKNKRANCCSTLLFYIAAFFAMFTAKELYFLHENWFLAVILFYYGVAFSWLNPSIFLIASLSMLFLCVVYKLRFVLLNPEMLNHFVPDIIMLETILFILMCVFPTQFILLLPLYNNCKWISFGGIMIGGLLTICIIIVYYSFYRVKKLISNQSMDATIDDRLKQNGSKENKIHSQSYGTTAV